MDTQTKIMLSKHSIPDYLAKRGFSPAHVASSGRLNYLCPLPNHTDTTPSFCVWPDKKPHRFKCYGCGERGTIIKLISLMEHKSAKDVCELLLVGIPRITADDVLNDMEEDDDKPSMDLGDILLEMAAMGRQFTEYVRMDSEECCIIDKFWDKIDRWLLEYEYESIEEAHNVLIDVLMLRQAKYDKIHNPTLGEQT